MRTGQRFKFGAFVLVAGMLAACSPTWDWRRVQPVDEPIAVMLPAKPATMAREINLDGREVRMTMHGALVEGQRFTAAWITVPDAGGDAGVAGKSRAAGDPALAAMQAGMLHNIEGTVSQDEARIVPVIDAAGTTIAQREGRFIEASGVAQGSPVRMQALFVGSGLYRAQFVVMGQDWSDEAAQVFFEGAALRSAPQGDAKPENPAAPGGPSR